MALCCNTVPVVATHSAALLRHTCRQMSRRAAVVAQMWAGDGLGCGADVGGYGFSRSAEVGKGSNQSSCRCGWGVDLVPVQMWAGMSPVRR